MKISLLLLLLSIKPLFSAELYGQVKSIHDGDTLTMVTDTGERKKVRLIGIDTPEVSFNGHSQGEIALVARDTLRTLIPIGSRILVDVEDYSLHYSRQLGTIFFDGKNINLTLIEMGVAAPYIIAPFDKSLSHDYLEAAKIAFENQEGFLFNEEVMPYEFRMIVQGRKGTNYVGNKETKELFYPDQVESVPFYQRIFFRSYEYALERGYFLP